MSSERSSSVVNTQRKKTVFAVTALFSERYKDNQFNKTQVFTNEKKAKAFASEQGQKIQKILQGTHIFEKEDDVIIISSSLNEYNYPKGIWATVKIEPVVLNGMIRK